MRGIGHKIRRMWRSLDAKYLRPGYEPSYPFEINIETSSVCNLRCSCCPQGIAHKNMRPRGLMSVETFRQVLDHIDIPIQLAYLHMHGEPFLNPNLPLFVKELNQRQIKVNLYSNATSVDEAALEAVLQNKHVTLTFSVDLLGKVYYENLRVGAKYEETLTKLDALNAVFDRYNRFFSIMVILDNSYADRTDELVSIFENLYKRYPRLNGITLGSKFPWPRLPWTGELEDRLGKPHHRCKYAFEGLSILWNGDASLCSFDYTGECVVGSLLDHTYTEVFNGPKARHFRMLHWRHRDNELPLCNDCLLDRYVAGSVTIHRGKFLKNEQHERKQVIESFYRPR